jgi:hypothetical protein
LFELKWTTEAQQNFTSLKENHSLKKRYTAVKKSIKYLAQNPRHPGLFTHEFESLKGLNGEKVFEAYAENDTSAAYRIFWHYCKTRGTIIILAITKHP